MTNYIITENTQFNSREVYFDNKPAVAVLDALKALKMRWNHKKACWYGYATESELVSAIIANGEGEDITVEKSEATVYTDGYLGGGAVYGSKSDKHLFGADLSRAIREDIKKAGIKGVSVSCKSYSGGQSVKVTVTLRADEFVSLPEWIENYRITSQTWIYTGESEPIFHEKYFSLSAREQEEIRRAAAEYEYIRCTERENQLNVYNVGTWTQFTPEARKKLVAVHDVINAYRYDESNAMVDYFDTNFYYDIYTKPAIN